MSNCGLVRLFALIFTLTFETDCIVHVAVELLFPVFHSILVVLMFAVFANTYHEVSKLVNVPVSVRVHPLPAGSVPIANTFVGILIFAGTTSVRSTLDASLPPLFPYVSV